MIPKLPIFSIFLLLLASFSSFSQTSFYEDIKDQIDFIVDAEGNGDFTTVQAAIDAVPTNSASRTVVFIRNGRYYEKVRISSSKKNLILVGEDMDSTIITFDDYAAVSGFDCTTVKVDADDFLAMNITFENGYDKRDSQALAMATYGDRQTFVHCRFNGFQDTYFSGSDKRAYFKDCLIIGDVDFIYGSTTILFDSCQIHNVRSGAYYTAASTPESHKFGYVFNKCWVTTEGGISNVWLGRPWRPYAHVAWMECYMSRGINPLGWNNWGNVDNEATARYEEYNCYGPGADTDRRVTWGKQLTDEVAATYTMENIFSKASNPSVVADWIPDVESNDLYAILKNYTFKFLDPELSNGRLTGLEIDGEQMGEFHPDSLFIGIELPSGTTEIPELTPTVSSEYITYEVQYPEELPGFAEVNVFTPYKAQNSVYEIYLSVDNAFSNADMISLEMYGKPVPDFDPEITSYQIGISPESPPFMKVTPIPRIEGSRIGVKRPLEIPGQYEITVTAVDKKSTKLYTVDVIVSVLSADSRLYKSGTEFVFENPVKGKLRGALKPIESGDLTLKILSTSGKEVFSKTYFNVSKSGMNVDLDLTSLSEGLYIYRIQSSDGIVNGRLINSLK